MVRTSCKEFLTVKAETSKSGEKLVTVNSGKQNFNKVACLQLPKLQLWLEAERKNTSIDCEVAG